MSSSIAHFSLMSAGWRDNQATAATPIATTTIQDLPSLPQAFFSRPAQLVAPDLIGCLLVKRQESGELLWGVIVETEAYSHQSNP
ncbi:DNA-3-methyladenine glycosylase II [Synechococcus sp. WH 8101]|nr:DNA-3-methyladenine glycosylase II [Synechococcus sp. WH 8101]QNI45648.1 putative 3-methyladenine DNA glycosylase domain protein [Synechococcus sp. WH 8101]